jgi:quinolinate synthase
MVPDHLERIDVLRRQRNAVILAHYYQESDIQDVADYIGDSLELARRARDTRADVIVFCGVHFMAETAVVLNPDRMVLLPDVEAGCSLAESCPAPVLKAWKDAHPDHLVVSYVNTTAATKALSDIICTSSNAVRVVESLPRDRPILFGPDRNLGAWVQSRTGRELTLWPGTCIVHETFSERALIALELLHPDALVIAHPECEPAILAHADFVGSTTGLLRFAVESTADDFIVATEPGVLHAMQKSAPAKTFHSLPGALDGCSCNVCPHMRRITLAKVAASLENLETRITLAEDVRKAALLPLERMLAL